MKWSSKKHVNQKSLLNRQNYVNPKETMGGRNQDAANLEASHGQMNKVGIKIPP